MHAIALILPLVILISWARLIRPGGNRLQGRTLLEMPLPLLARLRMHGFPALLALAIGAFLVVRGDMPLWAMAIPIVSDVLMIAIPAKYTLTDVGIRLGLGSFRRWTEFTGVRRAPGGARLLGMQRRPGFQIWLSGSRGDDEFLQYLRQTFKGAYKGTGSVIPFPVQRTTPPASDDRIVAKG